MPCKVTIIQTDIKWADPEANRIAVESALLASGPSDLYVLPEMWDTGFGSDFDCRDVSGRGSLDFMRAMAVKFDAAIAGSLAFEDAGRQYNRFCFVTPIETFFYDKRHLFSYASEDKTYTAGRERTIVEWRGVRYLLQVCYDLRFPCFSRNVLLGPDEIPAYDAAIYVANWPESRRRAWDVLLEARALENQSYVIGVNRVGDDPNCHYNGGSAVISPKGKILATVADNVPGTATTEVDMDSLKRFREKFPVLKDADK